MKFEKNKVIAVQKTAIIRNGFCTVYDTRRAVVVGIAMLAITPEHHDSAYIAKTNVELDLLHDPANALIALTQQIRWDRKMRSVIRKSKLMGLNIEALLMRFLCFWYETSHEMGFIPSHSWEIPSEMMLDVKEVADLLNVSSPSIRRAYNSLRKKEEIIDTNKGLVINRPYVYYF